MMKVLVTGSNGQLGRALQDIFDGTFIDVNELDITDREAVLNYEMDGIDAVINAAAYTNVDGAELDENRELAWKVNVEGTGYLALLANKHDIPLVHISTDYVFDGTKKGEWTEEDQPNPLSMYGLTKWISEAAAKEARKHYILRTSWVIGDGNNFVRTMLRLAESHKELTIVDDQIGRPTFTNTLAAACKTVLDNTADVGIYNVSNDGDIVSWADFAESIFEAAGKDVKVVGTSTEEYFKDKPHATRPNHSCFDLSNAKQAGIELTNWRDELKSYLND